MPPSRQTSAAANRRRPLAAAPVVRPGRRRRRVEISAFAVLALWAAVDHGRLVGRGGDDWAQFDHRAATVIAAPSSVELRVQSDHGPPVTVRLIGLTAPSADGSASEAGRQWLASRVGIGGRVILLLDGPAMRDAAGRLRAYAYAAADGGCVNVDVVKAGWATADRRARCPFDGLLRPAEADARKHGRGVWATSPVEVRKP